MIELTKERFLRFMKTASQESQQMYANMSLTEQQEVYTRFKASWDLKEVKRQLAQWQNSMVDDGWELELPMAEWSSLQAPQSNEKDAVSAFETEDTDPKE